MASHHYMCCCEGTVCDACETQEDWCWSFTFKHRYESVLDAGFGPFSVIEETATFENVHMTWSEELECYIAIGGTVTWKCEYKTWSWRCLFYFRDSPGYRPCAGCDPFPCDVITYEGTVNMAGRARMCCKDPCNLPDPPCGVNAFPTSELDIDVFGMGTYTLDQLNEGCSCSGIPDEHFDDVPWAFKCKIYGKPGCFTAEGPGEKTFDRYSVMPWVLCDYNAPTPQSGVGVGYFSYTGIPICTGEYVLPYNCKGNACPLDVRYNIQRNFGWTVTSCPYVIDPVPGGSDYGECWTTYPAGPTSTLLYDCRDVLRGRTFVRRHMLETSMSSNPYPC